MAKQEKEYSRLMNKIYWNCEHSNEDALYMLEDLISSGLDVQDIDEIMANYRLDSHDKRREKY